MIPQIKGKSIFFTNIFRREVGDSNKKSFGFSSIQLLSMGELTLGMITLPEFDFTFAPSPSYRLSATILPENLTLGWVYGGTFDAFRFPRVYQNSYSWDYLSNNGDIRISEDQYENCFLFGPLLNPGQVSVNVDCTHLLKLGLEELPVLWDGELEFSVGIPGNVSFTGNGKYMRTIMEVYEYDQLMKNRQDTIDIHTVFDWRTSFSLMQTGYRLFQRRNVFYSEAGQQMTEYLSDSETFFKPESNDNSWIKHQIHVLQLASAFITGPRYTTFQEVNGNWDGTFSPKLNEHQFLAMLQGDYCLSRSYSPIIHLRNVVKYGINGLITVSYNQEVTLQKRNDPYYVAIPGVHLSNISRRTKGPDIVSPFEYQFGYWPKKGEYLLDVQYKLPLNDPPVFSSPYFNDNTSSYSFNLNTMFNPFFNIWDFITGTYPDPRKEAFNDYDMKVSFSTGYFDNVCLFDVFSMRTVEVRSQELLSEEDSIENDFIFANQFGVAAGNPSRSLFTFMFGFFGETIFIDNEEEPSNILLSFLYTKAI